MLIVRWFFIFLVSMFTTINITWAKSYCDIDPQGVIRISRQKKDRQFKVCVPYSSLSVEIKKKMKNEVNYNINIVKIDGGVNTRKTVNKSRVDIMRCIKKQAGRYNVDPYLVNAIISIESGFNLNAVSSRGALGLMQLMPATAKELAKREKMEIKREHLFDPEINIALGVRYLAELGERYNNNLELVLAAYHAGIGNVAKYDNKVPPFKSTRRYVKDVTCLYNSQQTFNIKSAFCKP